MQLIMTRLEPHSLRLIVLNQVRLLLWVQKVMNVSLKKGIVSMTLKETILRSLLEDPNGLNNYSLVAFLGKQLKQVVATQL